MTDKAMTDHIHAITSFDFELPFQQKKYVGKVRDVYYIKEDYIALVASDRISAFDCIMPRGIPSKGEILTSIATKFLKQTEDIVPNWLISRPDPNVCFGYNCKPFKVEMVVRGYLAGHAQRLYSKGIRSISGASMPDGLKPSDPFPSPIITPSTKAEDGEHDEDISPQQIVKKGLMTQEEYDTLVEYSLKLFQFGSKWAKSRGLILVDTKYEFGRDSKGQIRLIDEIHTPDSSRYYYLEGYTEKQKNNDPQKQLSKEFLREWLMENGFSGGVAEKIPAMSDEVVFSIRDRYKELYSMLTAEKFIGRNSYSSEEIEKNLAHYLQSFFKENH